jgi:putative transcriptional regulator
MTSLRSDLLYTIRETLSKAGFYLSDIYPVSTMGFDIIARKDQSLLILKVLINIDALSEEVAQELKKLAHLLQATPILIGEKNSLGKLEDDVAYFRFGIQAITYTTFKNHIYEGATINAYAAPGGLYVKLNEQKLRKLRLEQNISLGQFARYVRVSRRTAQMYEEGMNARIEIAARIEELLGSSVIDPIDILAPSIPHNDTLSTHTSIKNFEDFQQKIFTILEKVGYHIIPMNRCPFEAVSTEKNNVLLTCVDRYNKKLIKKAYIITHISKITERHAVIFTDNEQAKENVEGTPVIRKRELKKIHDPDEIIELVEERK